jgi:hypothetical protein
MFIDINPSQLKKYKKDIQVGKVMFNIQKLEGGGYKVQSQHDRLKFYEVYHSRHDKWFCTCTEAVYHPKSENCIHILAGKEYEKYLQELVA